MSKPARSLLYKDCVSCLRGMGVTVKRISSIVHLSPLTINRLVIPGCWEYTQRSIREWGVRNKDKVKEYGRKWVENNPEKQRLRQLSWRSRNRHKANIYEKKALRFNPHRRIASNLRRRIRECVKVKSESSLVLLGCTIQEFTAHLESKFLEGMTWENYGKNGWHIDHIKPLTAFDLSISDQARQAFHFSNTQPLWAEDNIRKHNKI